MISLSVSRTSLGLIPLTASDTNTSTGAGIRAWNPGLVVRDVAIARSKWSTISVATRTTDTVAAASLVLFLQGGSLALSRALADSWAAALGQLDYTITESMTGASRVFSMMPTSVDLVDGPSFWRNDIVILSASIPRNPL